MDIILYISSSEKERVDKTAYLTEVGTFSGFLRSPSSVLNPSINMELGAPEELGLVDDDNIEVVDNDNIEVTNGRPRITDANYMYISEFGRFYFIQDITISVTGIYQITAIVDVLMSWRDNILNLNCFIDRNEFIFDATLEDSLLPVNYVKTQTEITPEDGAKVNTHFDAGDIDDIWSDPETKRIVVSVTTEVVHEEGRLGEVLDSTFDSPDGHLPSVHPNEFMSRGASGFYGIPVWAFASFCRTMLENDDLLSFVKACIILPFDPTEYMDASEYDIRVGTFIGPPHYLGVDGLPLYSSSGYRVVADFRLPQGYTYLDYPPFTHWEIYLPFYGYAEIDFSHSLGHRILVYYVISYEDGSATACVYDYDDRKMVFSTACQVGILLNISATNAKENETKKIANLTSLGVGLIGSAVSAGVGVVTDNPVAIAGGAMGVVKSITGYINTNAMIFDRAQTGNSGALSPLFNFLHVKLRKTSMTSVNADLSAYAHACGRPLRRFRQLSELTGLTIAKSVHLDGVPCYSAEAEKITELLALGVIL